MIQINLGSAKVLPSSLLFFQAEPVNIYSDEVEYRPNGDFKSARANNYLSSIVL